MVQSLRFTLRCLGRGLERPVRAAWLAGCCLLFVSACSSQGLASESIPIQPAIEAGADPTSPVQPIQATQSPLRDPAAGPAVITPAPAASPTPGSELQYEVIGYSVQGRPLEIFRFGSGSLHRLVVAGIHGGYEWNTIALADEMIRTLREQPELVPEGVTLHLLRALNPDGLANSKGYEGRANANGVDLNRNWSIGWVSEWPAQGCWNYRTITAGQAPASEPETVALMNYIIQYPFDAIINYHSAALGIFPGGQPPHARSVELAELVAEVSPYPYPPIETGCTYTGQFVDWAAYYDIAAVDVELRTHYDLDYEINLEVLRAFLGWGILSPGQDLINPIGIPPAPVVESR